MLNPADPAFIEALAARLPEGRLRPAEARYLEEPRGRWQGAQSWVALPRSTAEVATILAACHAARVGVIPYGGGTGLVGGQVAAGGSAPLILSLERMSAIRGLWPEENVLVAEAGAILADVQSAARGARRLFPLSLASEGSARIGGLLGTNAGGVNVLRYGNMRDLCLGLEVVFADGRVWNGLKRLRKDNTGYDLRHLMIGSEGTLGVITAASLRLVPQPAATGAAVLVVPSPHAALALLALAQSRIGEGISAFEIIGGVGLQFLSEVMPEVRQPFADQPAWSVLIDVGLSAGMDPVEALSDLYAEADARGLVNDGVIASSEAQRAEFWAMRENIPEANRKIGSVSNHDIALPLSEVPAFIERGPQVVARFGTFRINCFGHLGDGNLHWNIFPAPGRSRADHEDARPAIKKAVHDLVHELGGSVSAEHGIGRLKVDDLRRYSDPAKIAAMEAIKAALDPAGILNPGAMLG
jgi:FAD/FMN-containing dehydrogenase